MKLALSEVQVGSRLRSDLGDLQALADSIQEQGLLQPIGITLGKQLVFGVRRIEAFKLLGLDSIDARVVDVTSILEGELAENEVRKSFTIEERVAIGRDVEELLGKRQGQRTDQLREKFPEVPEGRNREIAGERCGFGTGRTYEKAKAVVEAAENDASKAPLVEEMNRTGKVHGAYKKLRTQQGAPTRQAKPLPDPDGTFDVIVIDPPWPYESRPEDASHRASNPYPTLSVSEIASLPIPAHLEPNAIVWLWTTNAFMREAYQVADSWGLRVPTILTWVKHKMGVGDWLRGKTEHCLLCVRGRPTVTLTNQTTALSDELQQGTRK